MDYQWYASLSPRHPLPSINGEIIEVINGYIILYGIIVKKISMEDPYMRFPEMVNRPSHGLPF